MWILDYLWIPVAVALGALLLFIAYRLYKNKKAGNSSCGCGCSNCAMRGECQKRD